MPVTGEPDDPDGWLRFHLCNGPHWSAITRLGVAVSGGSDSLALLHILARCAPEHGVAVEAATVDHGLRVGSAEEANFVRTISESLDCHHETLRWEDWDGRGNLQAEARAARYRLLGAWARRRGLDAVALGHTMDDQAETFLMRLGREAGVDGLAAMERRFVRDGVTFLRPALMLRRADLRDFLTRHGLGWRDDPSNADATFDRVKARHALVALEPLGLDAGTLMGVAVNMAAARDALRQVSYEMASRIARVAAGDVVLDRQALLAGPWEIQRRLVAAALGWVAAAGYPPRRDALVELMGAILKGESRTLNGCLVTTDDKTLRIAREYNAVKDRACPLDRLWDGRWRVTGPARDGCEIRALGAAVKDCPDWRSTGLPRASLMASPAVWAGGRLVSAPLAGFAGGYSAEIANPRGDFVTCVLSD